LPWYQSRGILTTRPSASMARPRQIAIVMTTINDGAFLTQFRPLLTAAAARSDMRLGMFIAGDRKTPLACRTQAETLAAQGLPEQAETIEAAGLPQAFVPYDSDNRRNIAVLAALQHGADVLVSLDDDNWPADPDRFLALYGRVGQTQTLSEATSDGRWPNLCGCLDIRSGWTGAPVTVFARGHPLGRRSTDSAALTIGTAATGRVMAHIGLWRDQPDVDAATRAALAPLSQALTHPGPFLAAASARAPMSTQNLAVARALVPAWWYVRMGPMASGRRLDRFGDMFQGYFASMVIDAVGGRFAFGAPLVTHERNPHTLLHDLEGEMSGMALLEDLLPFLETTPTGAAPHAAYDHIAANLMDALPKGGGMLGRDALLWAEHTAQSMTLWSAACQRLMR
jgi:hypothetical protein